MTALGLQWSIRNVEIFYPLGLSFFALQALSYIWDVYEERVRAEPHIGYFALYMAFFPQAVERPVGAPRALPQAGARAEGFPLCRPERPPAAHWLGAVQEDGDRRPPGGGGECGFRRPGRLSRTQAGGRRAGFLFPDLPGLLRLHRHRPERGGLVGLRPHREFQSPLPGDFRGGFLAALAHFLQLLAARLRLSCRWRSRTATGSRARCG